jgi:Omp85 superfamily domain
VPLRSSARLTALVLLLAPAVAAAQGGNHPPAPDSARGSARGAAHDSTSAAVVSEVVVERRQVFDVTPESPWFEKIMNKFHVTTRENVIRRELLVQPGNTYDSARAAESERNLRALNAFRLVTVDSASRDSSLATQVVTGDAWTTKPYLSLRSTGGQASVGIGINESNLLGRLISVGAKYKHEPDRSSLELSLNAPRVIDQRVGVSGAYTDFSDGRKATFEVGLPFLSLSSMSRLQVDGEAFDGRVLQYTNGDPDPSDSLRRKFAIARLTVGRAMRASPLGYLRLELTGQTRREDFDSEPPPANFPRSVTGAVTAAAEARRAHFIVTQNYRNIGPQEDVDLSLTVRAGASLAPGQWGYERTGIGPLLNLSTGLSFGGRAPGFSLLEAEATTLYNSAGLDSGTFTLRSTTAFQLGPRNAAFLFVGGGRKRNPAPGAEFDLGLTRGPRAFPQHSFTGDHVVFTSAEYRWTAIPELWSLVGIGLAGFFDYGGAWFGGSPRRTGTDTGIGLRIGSARFPSVNGAVRVDLAYRFANDVESAGWVVALGTGFVFERIR